MPCRWADVGLGDATRVRCRRRFGYPGRIDASERVWLTVDGADGRLEAWLNDTALGRFPGERPWEHDITALLRERNELVLDVEGGLGLCGEVALEVRCRAFLRDVRLKVEGRELCVSGEVVGPAEGELELYVVCGRSPVGYARVVPGPGGQPFAVRAEVPAAQAAQPVSVQVDLVNRASVWYTVFRDLAPAGR
jgi:hypothetical protein